MKQTNEVEKYCSSGSSYLDCFKGTDLRRTEIACMVWMTQTLCGLPLTGCAAYFYVSAGFASQRAYDPSTGMYGLAIVAGLLSWGSMRIFGRRTLYIAGCIMAFGVLLIGVGIATGPRTPGQSWAVGSIIILFPFIYDSAIGPVCYSLVAEIPSTRLRTKTVVLARVTYNIVAIMGNVLMPKMLNPTAWNWAGKTCFFWAGPRFLCLVWCYFRLPEPQGLTYMELDVLFERKAKAKKFKQVQTNLASTGYFSLSTPCGERRGWL